jgi:dipeptidyl aminopeptidase/acylaminoacyl peptidase
MATRFGIDRYLNIRSASAPSFSPDGRFVSFLTNITGVAQLWQVPVGGGWPTQLTFTTDTVRGAAYNPRRPELIFSMDHSGNEQTQLYRLHGIAGNTDHGLGDGWAYDDLTRQPSAVHQFGGWNHEGDAFAFSSNRDDPSRFDLYVQRVGDREARLLHKGPGGYYLSAGWSADDKHLLVGRMESNFNQDLYVVEVGSGKERHLTPHDGDVQYQSPVWLADGQAVYCVSTHGGRDLLGLARIDLDRGKLSYLETPEQEVEVVQTSPRGRWLAWRVNAGGQSALHLRDLKDNRTRTWSDMPLGVVTGLEFSHDDSKLALVFDGPQHNADVWIWDLASPRGEASRPYRLTQSSLAGIPADSFVKPTLVHYKTFDGRMIPAWFYPVAREGERLPPVIVYPHGGPESQTRPVFNPIFQFFQQHGYAILAPNVRGSTGYGSAYMNLDNTTKRMDSVNDLAHAVHYLRDEKLADPKRVAVYGGSYGGFMVLASVTHYPELWAAGIDVVGICNFVTFLEKTGAYRRAHREAEYGNLREHREFFEKISPIHHVDRIQCPMMVIHGANDPRVPIEEAEQIVAALKKRGLPVEYLRYEDEGHGLVKLKNRLDAYPKMAAFLDRYLK